jgi:hypothetical protein
MPVIWLAWQDIDNQFITVEMSSLGDFGPVRTITMASNTALLIQRFVSKRVYKQTSNLAEIPVVSR